MPQLLALVTPNTAEVLKLTKKGRLEVGAHGDILMLDRAEFRVVHVLAQGKHIVEDGRLVAHESFLEGSNREIAVVGEG